MQKAMLLSKLQGTNQDVSDSAVRSDDKLLTAVATGDRRAMEALYARHRVKLYRFLLRLVGNAATAEDLVSEVFFDVWRHASGFEGRSGVATWIFAIARYKAMSMLRRRTDEQLDEGMAAEIPDGADDAEGMLTRLQLCGAL
jgi:RNA polymerase sigma-70 factor (ECF subfamily)